MLPRTTVTGYYDYNWLTALEKVTDHLGPGGNDASVRQRFWKIRAKQVVLATGAIERPLVFAEDPHWNEAGCALVGRTLADHLVGQGWLK